MTNKTAREALEELINLNDNHSYFGGEIYRDKVDATWESARQVLAKLKSENSQALEPPLSEDVQEAIEYLKDNGDRGIVVDMHIETLIRAAQAQPETVTVEELSQEYVDAVYASFPSADLNRHSAHSQDFLHFIKRFYPNGIRIVKEVK